MSLNKTFAEILANSVIEDFKLESLTQTNAVFKDDVLGPYLKRSDCVSGEVPVQLVG